MNTDDNEYDASLGQRLSDALGRKAASIDSPPDAWSRFQEREHAGISVMADTAAAAGRTADATPDAHDSIVIVNADGTHGQAVSVPAAGGGDRAATSGPRRRTWRAPLIAAAAVIAVAVATSAIATNGFRGTTDARPAAGTSGSHDPAAHGTAPIDGSNDPAAAPTSAELVTTNAAGEVGIPFNASPDIYAVATGSAGGAPASRLIEPSAGNAAAPQPTLWLKFAGGAPPAATLETRFQTAGKLQTVQYDPTKSDGTPLGYLAHMVSLHAGPAGAVPPGDVYLWGVVGPEVAQVQIMAALSTTGQTSESAASGDTAATVTTPASPGMSPAPESDTTPDATSAHWTFDSGFGTAFSLAGSETAPWVAMPGGYHAFAVHPSTNVESIDVIALGAGGEQLQIRRFDLGTGQVSDLPVPPPSAPDNAPPTTSTATSVPPIATTASGLPDAPSSAGGAGIASALLGNGNGPGSPVVVTYLDTPDQAHHDALLQGTIRVVDGCVAIASDHAATIALPVFPASQIEPAAPPAALRWHGTDYAVGDSIAVGGSFAADGYFESQTGWPTQCSGRPWPVAPAG